MRFYSTNNRNEQVSFRTALIQGLAHDKGLFMPQYIPKLDKSLINNLSDLTFQEISYQIASKYIEDEIGSSDLGRIISSSITFECPLVKINETISILELFHGPTLAFKDFGARFMARTMEHFLKQESKELTILVATSGDTGSAVANGFLNVEGINVVVLYPKDKISKIQQKQITTLGGNIIAIEIEGTFDDCQKLVKTAFVDNQLKENIRLSSANSINIGRLIPQSFYYFEAVKQLNNLENIIFSVPSGNLGNLTAGLFAKIMGLPIQKFIAATNSNNVFTDFINTGKYSPRISHVTLSNAMDVGDPSNLARIKDIFNNDHKMISNIIISRSFSDSETINKIKEIYSESNYIIDPHGAIGCLAFDWYNKTLAKSECGVVLETAHPSKFMDVFTDNLNFYPEMPSRLESCLEEESISLKLSNNYNDFKSYLMN